MIQQLSTPVHGRRLLADLLDAPAAGDEVVITVPPNTLIEPVFLQTTLVAQAAGGNRRLSILFGIGPRNMQSGWIHDTQGPGTTNAFFWQAGYHEYFDFAAVNETYQGFPPGIILQPGDTIETATVNRQAADQWSTPTFVRYETLIVNP